MIWLLELWKSPQQIKEEQPLEKKQAKAKRIIFDSVKDNLMLVIALLRTTKECFDALANLYEKKAPTQKRVL